MRATMTHHGLAPEAVACVASLDLKADEPAVTAIAEALAVPARFFSAAELEAERPRLANPSDIVFREVGCHGVAEGAALAAAGEGSALVVEKTRSGRATCAVARAARPSTPPPSAGHADGWRSSASAPARPLADGGSDEVTATKPPTSSATASTWS